MIGRNLIAPPKRTRLRWAPEDSAASRRRAPPHVHRCPECYEPWPCGGDCTIEPDLALENGMPCGAYCTCPTCERKASDRAPELRARHRAEAVAAFTTTREEEIDPVPSSRPAALVEQGFPWTTKEGAT